MGTDIEHCMELLNECDEFELQKDEVGRILKIDKVKKVSFPNWGKVKSYRKIDVVPVQEQLTLEITLILI